jgi:hypothetical protein
VSPLPPREPGDAGPERTPFVPPNRAPTRSRPEPSGAGRSPAHQDDDEWEALWAAQRDAVPHEARAEPYRPRVELGGLSADEFGRLVSASWNDADGPLWFVPYVDPALLDAAPIYRRAHALLALVRRAAAAITTYGELPPGIVVPAVTELDWPAPQRPAVPTGRLREQDAPAVTALAEALSRAGLLDLGQRRPYAPVRLTPAGERTLAGESQGTAFGRLAAALWREPSRAGAALDPFRSAPGLRGVLSFSLWTLRTLPSATPADAVAAHAWPERLRATLNPAVIADVTRTGLLGQGAGLGLLQLRRLHGRTVASRTALFDAAVRTTLPRFVWPEPAP